MAEENTIEENVIEENIAAETRCQEQRKKFITALRELADFLDAHPTVAVPEYGVTINVFVDSKEELAAHAKTSTWQKQYFDTWFVLSKLFHDRIDYQVNLPREQICRRVVVGTEVVPAQPEREVEKVKWVCEESLLEA